MSPTRAVALVLLGAALFGTVGIAKGLGPPVHDVQLAALRLTLAAAIFAVLAGSVRVDLLRSRPMLVAGLAQAVFQVGIFTAFSGVGVAVGTLVGIGLSPLIAGLLSRTWTPRWAASTGVALTGLVLLVGTGGRLDWLGLLAALVAATALATYIVAIGRPAPPSDVGERLAAIFTIGAVGLLLPALVVGGTAWVGRPTAWLLVLYLAVVPTVLAYRSYNAGAAHLPAGSVATFGLAEPVVAAVLGVVVLGETMTVAGAVGAVLIVAAVLLLVVAHDREKGTRSEDVLRD